jgi:ElaB/YqjD/DUF883 family membrane-anchored ribosome-binding protein
MTNSTTYPTTPDAHPANGTTPAIVQGAAQGAHHTIDRLAEQATPHVQRLQEKLAGATQMLDERAGQIREVAHAWTEGLRTTVRDKPLTAVGAALVLGMVLARVTR